MNRLKKYFVMLVVGLVVAGGALTGWVLLTWERLYDEVPYPQLTATTDPDVIARGRYLARGPAHCSICHVASLEEMVRADAGEEIPMQGGMDFPIGPLAVLYTANLTPDVSTGIGRYTDRELFRLLRHNVKPNGRASIAPLMPFANMADDDLVAIVSYLRTTAPVRHDVPAPRWTILGKTISALARPTALQPVVGHTPPSSAPPQGATIERGAYLANSVSNCMACHSPIDRTTGALTGPAFSGNPEGELSTIDPNVMLRAPNLTRDPTGILGRVQDEEVWVGRFRAGRLVPESIMPWGPFSRMSDDDLRALYRYLKSLDPVVSDVGPVVERVKN
jgi:mono/diheme cytochrome c family protein